jgi:hypothetical protein
MAWSTTCLKHRCALTACLEAGWGGDHSHLDFGEEHAQPGLCLDLRRELLLHLHILMDVITVNYN